MRIPQEFEKFSHVKLDVCSLNANAPYLATAMELEALRDKSQGAAQDILA